MRALGLALLICVPLRAGDRSPLQEAVELFASPDAGKRAVGSQMADRELRRLLAPLLEAMETNDPEVRRRARRAILALVPEAADPELTLDAAMRQRAASEQAMWKGMAAARAQAVRIQLERKRDQLDAREVRRLLDGFGVEAELFRGVIVIGPATIAGGYRVLKVNDLSHAAHAGLRPGDFILRVQGEPARSPAALLAALGPKPDWTKVRLDVLRRGELLELRAR
jgi:C-terminal processing protease CtpA/Prc